MRLVRRHQGKMSTSSVLHPGRYWDSWTLTSTLACLTSLHFFSPYALQQQHRYPHQPVTPHFTHTATPACYTSFHIPCNTSLSPHSTHCNTSLLHLTSQTLQHQPVTPHFTHTATPACYTSLHTHCNTSLSPHSTHPSTPICHLTPHTATQMLASTPVCCTPLHLPTVGSEVTLQLLFL